ncbi:MAG: CHAT domain-containing protein [Bacteroidetes bacterium]|nr:CHAT domain-containing protein [Bacteroidota bacterium]
MAKTVIAFLLTVFLLVCFSQVPTDAPPAAMQSRYAAAMAKYRQAEHIVSTAGDNEPLLLHADTLYSDALILFQSLQSYLHQPKHDSLLFMTRLRTGYIHFYFDSLEAAKTDYLEAIHLHAQLSTRVADSLLFLPYLYTGAVFYTQNQFDSALVYYKLAEQLNDRHPKPLKESQRLFNRLGVMFYENGNYTQARNYFEKAITVYEKSSGKDQTIVANFQNNIASILVKLEDYDAARTIYESLLSTEVFNNEIYHNLGIIFLRKNEPQKALSYFRKVTYTDERKSTDLYYNFAVAHAALQNTDSADFWLHRAIAENIRWNGHRRNAILGLILKFQGDMAVHQKHFREAASFYQESIMQFAPGFNESDITKNPSTFITASSYINLFNVLTAKADALRNLYESDKNIPLLQASLGAYEAAFQLADYVSSTYDSDESRLFLNKIKHFVHNKPIEISLELFERTGNKDHLHSAYLFDQRNKASILSLNVRENELKYLPGNISNLLNEEAHIKSNITRWALKASTLSDSSSLEQLFSQIRDSEIELGKLREKINADPEWQHKNATEQIPPVIDLQKKLDPYSALLSYHLSENGLLIFVITTNSFEYHPIPVNKSFYTNIEVLKSALQNTNTGERYSGTEAASALYLQLIAPIATQLQQKKRLIIIPDDELNYLPFESLQDAEKKYLVEKFAVQYQFSTPLVVQSQNQYSSPGTLAFAPFAARGYEDSAAHTSFAVLPASKEETGSLSGTVLMDNTATKANFLKMANHFGVLHLATHASVNNEDPGRSYITFYPGQPDYKLYAREIYDLHLDSTRLIILSACETGTGQLIKGEGLMSLSRAFTYAGCPNIITSLWKAEDKATAFITSRLHYYLERKYTRDEALQQAKLDLLRSSSIDPRYKSPQYWAHLICIGNYEAEHKGKNWWWIAIVMIGGAILYKLSGLRKAKKKKG